MGCDDYVDLLSADADKERPLLGHDPGYRLVFGDYPAFTVGDSADVLDPLVWIAVVMLIDAADLVFRGHV
jgi:hypothetical protein